MTTKDEQPAQQEICGGCKGSGWVTRDPDIGTDQECFVCEGKGTVEPEHPAPATELREQEPAFYRHEDGHLMTPDRAKFLGFDLNDLQALYTSPPAQRKPLTDEQWQVIADTLDCVITRGQKNVIEATLGIKE